MSSRKQPIQQGNTRFGSSALLRTTLQPKNMKAIEPESGGTREERIGLGSNQNDWIPADIEREPKASSDDDDD